MTQSETAPSLAPLVLTERTQLQLPTNLDLIEPTVEYLKSKALLCDACDESQSSRLVLALHEALTNAMVHGNLEVSSCLKEVDHALFAQQLAEHAADPGYASRQITISIDYDGERCQWSLTDEGPGFDFEEVLNRPEPEPEDLWAVSGRGVLLMRTLLDGVRYEAGGRRCILTLKRPARPEKREHTRWPMHKRVQVAPIRSDGSVDWQAAYEAVTQNLSQGGLSLLQARLAEAERVLVGLELNGEYLYLPAQIRHCKSVRDDMMELGCSFLLSEQSLRDSRRSFQNVEEAIDELLQSLQCRPLVDDERRQHPRVSYTERIEVEARGDWLAQAAYARDISRGGISFIATEALAPEERILSLPQTQGSPLRLRSKIIRCDQIAEGFYDVAARFQEVV